MSVDITEAFVQQYKDNVTILSQQRGSKLRPMARIESGVGKSHFFERIGPTAAIKKTVRHGDVKQVDTIHTRRMAVAQPYEWLDYVDDEDKLRTLIDAESAYVINAGYAIGRAFDDEFISAIGGTAKTGETGSGSQVLPAGQKIAADFPVGGAAEGLTINKLREAKLKLDNADVEEMDRFAAISPAGLQDLLETTEVGSADFNTVRALVNGELDTFLGFKFIVTTRLIKTGNNRACYFWQRNAMGMYELLALDVFVGLNPNKMNQQVYVKGDFGGVRLEDEAVVEVTIDESV
jgi:hypothetical protein